MTPAQAPGPPQQPPSAPSASRPQRRGLFGSDSASLMHFCARSYFFGAHMKQPSRPLHRRDRALLLHAQNEARLLCPSPKQPKSVLCHGGSPMAISSHTARAIRDGERRTAQLCAPGREAGDDAAGGGPGLRQPQRRGGQRQRRERRRRGPAVDHERGALPVQDVQPRERFHHRPHCVLGRLWPHVRGAPPRPGARALGCSAAPSPRRSGLWSLSFYIFLVVYADPLRF